MDLTPVQERTLVELMGSRDDRPVFDPALAGRLRDELEDRVTPAAAGLREGEQLWMSKGSLAEIHLRCEGLWIANRLEPEPFSYGMRLAVGKLVHGAVELSVYASSLTEAELVDRSLAKLVRDDERYAEFVEGLDEPERAELEGEAVRQTILFRSTFPPLQKTWTPSVELSLKASLAEERIIVSARPDLVLGSTDPDEPMRGRRLILELKSGTDRPEHDEDVRLYALVATLRFGVPPFRVATVELESGTWRIQDVSEDLLRTAARRLADGCVRAVELLKGADPTLRPGPWCGWCPRAQTCPSSSVRVPVRPVA